MHCLEIVSVLTQIGEQQHNPDSGVVLVENPIGEWLHLMGTEFQEN